MSNLLLAGAAGRTEFLGFPLPGRPITSLILEAEGNRYTFRDWIRHIAESLGVNGSLPLHFHQRNAELAIDGPTLEGMIAETGAEIVFMDTIGRFWTGKENDATEWRAGVTIPLDKLSRAYNVAFAFGDHYNKPNENRRGSHQVRGTPAKIQDCGATLRLEIGKGGDRSRVLFIDRVKDGALPDPPLVALTIDLQAGTISKDDNQDALVRDAQGTPDARQVHVREIVQDVGGHNGGMASTAMIVIRLKNDFQISQSQAEALITSAHNARLVERAAKGLYRIPGAIQ